MKRAGMLLFFILCGVFMDSALCQKTWAGGERTLRFTAAADSPAFLDRLLYTAFRRIGYELTIETTGTTSALQMAASGEKDGLAAYAAGIDKHYPGLIEVPESLTQEKIEVYGRESARFTVTSWDDLANLRVGTLFYKSRIEKRLPRDLPAHIKRSSFPDLLQALKNDECDVLVISNFLPADLPVPDGVKKIGQLESTALFSYLNFQHAGLASRTAAALQSMKRDGTFARIVSGGPEPFKSTRNVLLITSYSANDSWDKRLRDGFAETLSRRGNIAWQVVSLNSNHIPGNAGRAESILSGVRAIIMMNPPDVLVAADLDAQRFLEEYYPILSHNTPVVLCGINSAIEQNFWKFGYNCTAVAGEIPAAATIKQIIDLLPDTRHIFVINDHTETGLEWRRQIVHQLRILSDNVDVAFNRESSFEALQKDLKDLPENTAVLFGHYNLDSERTYRSQQEIQTAISRSTDKPVFGMRADSIGYGQVGGKYVDSFLHGRAAADLAISIVDSFRNPGDGEKEPLFIIRSADLNAWIFDEHELERHAIGSKNLPAKSLLLNRKLTLYEANPGIFALTCSLFFLALIAIANLSISKHILQKKNEKLEEMQKTLHTAEELLERDHEIRDIKERLEAALAISSSGVWELDVEKDLFTCDDVAAAMLLFERGCSIPLDRLIDRLSALEEGFMETPFGKGVQSRCIPDRNVGREIAFTYPDGSTRYLNSFYKTLKSPDGENTKVVGMLVDITPRVQMSRDLLAAKEAAERAKEAAEAANLAKSDFLSSISHEIRTPMNAIVGMSELLLAEKLTPRQASYVRDIEVSSIALLEIINDVLDISKIGDGRFRLDPVNFDFKDLLSNLKAIFSFAAQAKGLIFMLNVEKNLPPYLFGDDVRLRQILVNILGNAIKFTERGHILLEVKKCGANLCFDISDTGIGIKSENLDRLFNPFDQFDQDKKRRFTGTGLGLSITKSLLDLMHGSIEVQSEYGRGSRFHIEIPLIPGDGSKIAAGEPQIPFVTAPTAKVLVVDDNAINLNVAVGMMKLHRIDCDVARSGMEALGKIKKTGYDLVFMDHMMPDMDGIETTSLIRELESGQNGEKLVIVAMTANAVEGVREKLVESGMNDYLSKPVQDRFLNAILAKWLPKTKVQYEENSPVSTVSSEKAGLFSRLNALKELDLAPALARINGMEELYEQSLGIVLQRLPGIVAKLEGLLNAGDLKNFTVEIHGLKNSLANIGATELSNQAWYLETRSREKDSGFCLEFLPGFVEKLVNLHQVLSQIVAEEDSVKDSLKKPGLIEELKEKLVTIRLLLIPFSDIEVIELVRDVLNFDYGHELNRTLRELMNCILSFDPESAAALIDGLQIKE